MPDDPAVDAAAWVHGYVVRRTWLECAAIDMGAQLAEFEPDILLHVAGPPLIPARPTTSPPPPPPRMPAEPEAVTAWLGELDPWVTGVRNRLAGRIPGLRKDVEAVWSQRARWAWEHHARGEKWGAIAERDLSDATRWRDVKRLALKGVAVGCGGTDPRVMLDGLRGMLAAYASLGSPETDGGNSLHV